MCLKIDTPVFEGLDTLVESAPGSSRVVCTSEYSMRWSCRRVEGPINHCVLDNSIAESTLICIVRALVS